MVVRFTNRGKIYLRRSKSRQESSLETQLDWGIAEAKRHNVHLDASQADLQYMRAHGLSQYKDIFLDDSITGSDMNRPGFRALIDTMLNDKSYSHLFIHKRDRLARPEDAISMVGIEKSILLAGVTIVFSGSVSEPMEQGRQYIERDLAMLFGYYESGEFLNKLSERILDKQRLLALAGYRVGGNAPYGFERVLVNSQDQVLEVLPRGRTVRQEGCHVRVRPEVNGERLKVRLYILDLKKKGWGIKRIATHLTKLGIPSPDAGRTRKDHGVTHLVSGKWNHNTVGEICADPINVALQEYGRRSEGKFRRLSADGWRLLTETDRTADDKPKPRTIKNAPDMLIKKPANFEPLMDLSDFEQMRSVMLERGKSQRGIPHAKCPGSA